MIPNNSDFHNFGCISYNNEKTHIYAYKTLLEFRRPIQHIPAHILIAPLLCVWRDQGTNCLDVAARRVVCGLALEALAIIGVVDATARLVLTCFEFIRGSKNNAKVHLDSFSIGLENSLYYATRLQVSNLRETKLAPCLGF